MRRAVFIVAMLGGCTPVPDVLDVDVEVDVAASDDGEHDAPSTIRPIDDRLEALGIGPIRTHPLWPTPSNDACPAAMFASLGPTLNAGDMFRRTHARLAAVAATVPPSELSSMYAGPRMTDLALLRDHLGVPGLRLVAALDYSSSCMMGWSHQHCFVTSDAVYCPGEGAAEIDRMVDALSLAPHDLDPAGWFELVVALLGIQSMVLYPDEIAACTRVAGAHTVAPEVTIDADRVTVQLTEIEGGAGVLHYVVIEVGGEVRASRHVLWKAPAEEDVWGDIDAD